MFDPANDNHGIPIQSSGERPSTLLTDRLIKPIVPSDITWTRTYGLSRHSDKIRNESTNCAVRSCFASNCDFKLCIRHPSIQDLYAKAFAVTRLFTVTMVMKFKQIKKGIHPGMTVHINKYQISCPDDIEHVNNTRVANSNNQRCQSVPGKETSPGLRVSAL